jgi:hypothetical protein
MVFGSRAAVIAETPVEDGVISELAHPMYASVPASRSRPVEALDNVATSVPRFEPERSILSSRPDHVGK